MWWTSGWAPVAIVVRQTGVTEGKVVTPAPQAPVLDELRERGHAARRRAPRSSSPGRQPVDHDEDDLLPGAAHGRHSVLREDAKPGVAPEARRRRRSPRIGASKRLDVARAPGRARAAASGERRQRGPPRGARRRNEKTPMATPTIVATIAQPVAKTAISPAATARRRSGRARACGSPRGAARACRRRRRDRARRRAGTGRAGVVHGRKCSPGLLAEPTDGRSFRPRPLREPRPCPETSPSTNDQRAAPSPPLLHDPDLGTRAAHGEPARAPRAEGAVAASGLAHRRATTRRSSRSG